MRTEEHLFALRFPLWLFFTRAWWSQSGSNRRPPACKAGALPAELWPLEILRTKFEMVGLGGLEPPTSPLSGVRSNHLSYRPIVRSAGLRRWFPLQTCARCALLSDR
jgi:hypothetical protein